ncbi:MAG: cytochrome c biogenesis protein CcdA [Candidatus Methanoperedens sp.]
MTFLDLASPLILLTGLIAGIRHGIDWDHIAAISDITSTQNKVGKGIFMSFLYGLGHASVVAAIALGLLLVSFSLPQGVDRFMETIVGITLIILGIYVFYSLHKKKGEDFRMLPRWALAANAVLNSYSWLKVKLTNTPRKHHHVLKDGYGNRASYLIGMIHGIGAETPSQMLLFALAISAGAAAQKELGAVIIVVYSLGLVTTNTLMGVLGAYGYVKSSRRQKLYRSAAFVTGAFSIVLGTLFLFGGVSYLPDLETLVGGR